MVTAPRIHKMTNLGPERHDGVAGQCGSRCRSGDRRSILPPPYGAPLSRAARWSTGQCGSRCRTPVRRTGGERRSIPSEARSAERAGEGAALEGSWDFIRAVPTDPRPPPRPARHSKFPTTMRRWFRPRLVRPGAETRRQYGALRGRGSERGDASPLSERESGVDRNLERSEGCDQRREAPSGPGRGPPSKARGTSSVRFQRIRGPLPGPPDTTAAGSCPRRPRPRCRRG